MISIADDQRALAIRGWILWGDILLSRMEFHLQIDRLYTVILISTFVGLLHDDIVSNKLGRPWLREKRQTLPPERQRPAMRAACQVE